MENINGKEGADAARKASRSQIIGHINKLDLHSENDRKPLDMLKLGINEEEEKNHSICSFHML